MGDEVSVDLPFRGEYAKSGRSSCKLCKTNIDKGELRMAVMVQSPMFDGKVPNWHHVKCFFQRNRPKTVGDIGHFDALRWEDQERLTQLVDDALVGVGPSGGKGSAASKANKNTGLSKNGTLMKDFRVEIAKSGGAACRVCEVKITKGLARIGKKDYDSQRAKMYGPYDRWHHVECFAKNREDLEFFDSGDKLDGFKTVGKDDQILIKEALKEVKSKRKSANDSVDEPDSKKPRMDDKTKEELKKQTKKIYYYRDMLEKAMKKKQLVELMEYNDQEVPTGNDKMLDRLSDIMMFGALEKCDVCGDGQFVFRSGVGYQCLGNMSEWTKCQEKTLKPKRKEFKLPPGYREEYDFLKLYKFKEKERVIPNTQSSFSASQESNMSSSQGSIKSNPSVSLPLKDLTFVLEGKVDKDSLKPKIESLGGKIGKKVSDTTAAVISTSASVLAKRKTKNISTAEELGIQVVSEDIFEDVRKEGILYQIKNKSICDWGSDPKERLGTIMEKARSGGQPAKGSHAAMFSGKDMPKSMKLKLKGGAYVDPESNMEHKAHVYKVKEVLYSVVLGSVDIQSGKNSYYKLQLLEHDVKKKYYIFRSWGRVGTTIGGTKTEDFYDKEEALELFKRLYEEKTGNRWIDRKNFQKVQGKMFPMELDLGQENTEVQKLSVKESKSKLDKAIQELVAMIFDIDSMKKALVEFEIDLTKMPLGKLSRNQIKNAYKILTEVQDMIRNETGNETKFLDASNRFFTLIPHDFGMKSPPILNDPDIIKSKISMLDNLLEIEIAFNLLQSTDENANEKDPIDTHFEKLNTQMEVLNKDTEEFKILEKYVKNTHASTHTMYALEIEEVFKISRKGEKERFAKYKDLNNRMLLWHGSRTTNYAGILSQGLRIAPPEAPPTGYMFGKGIYFADMVTKSANYCQTSRSNNTGLMLLCDVALGEMYKRTEAEYVEKLPKGLHSTKGLGKTEPDPKEFHDLDGVKVPLGKGVKSKEVKDTTLLYNEYIIYDINQCNAKYLFKMKFNFKY